VPIEEFHLDLADLVYVGQDLMRPESVLAQPDGTLWVSDMRGGVLRIASNGEQQLFAGLGGEPNGLAQMADGSLVIANMDGLLQKLDTAGICHELLSEVDGIKLTCVNYAFIDRQKRIWIACSTREQQWWDAAIRPRPDGYIVLLDERGARIVRDDIYFTNEIRLDADEQFLYVAETMLSHIVRFRVQSDGSLTDREVVGPADLGRGAFVDGFAFDSQGNIWVTTILRNSVGVITPKGDYHIILEDVNEASLNSLEEKFLAGTACPLDMLSIAGETLKLISSVAFGGPDLQTVYLGSVCMNTLPTFRSPVAGLPLSHWK
jgi:sugar lactone lactonase YvrE